jgi:hypothetical protein
MTFRRATRASAHLTKDWEIVCERAFFRLVNAVKEFEFPAEVDSPLSFAFFTHLFYLVDCKYGSDRRHLCARPQVFV